MPSPFFSQDELAEITGLVKPSAQERLLQKWGLRVWRNASNRVILLREAYTQWQLGATIATANTKPEPKLRSINATPQK